MKYFRTSALVIILSLSLVSCGKKADRKITFDHTYGSYAVVLTNHVKGELVDYASLKADRASLDGFIKEVADLSLKEFDEMDDAEHLALWLNAYNAFTLRSIIDAYPVNSVQDIEGMFDSKRWTVAGKSLTLDGILHDVLRSKFDDPRIYLAINTGSKGSPALFAEPFTPDYLDEQLDSVASAFVNNVDRNTINPHNNTISTCEIFSIFGDDFIGPYSTDEHPHLEPAEAAVLEFLFSYADESIFEFVDLEAEWSLEYRPFDWSLNDVKK